MTDMRKPYSLPALLSSLLLIASGIAAAETPIKPFALDFTVSRNDKALGEAQLKLEKTSSETWTFRTHTKGTAGLASIAGVEIDERSEFAWHDGKPQTLRYAFDQKMRFKSKQRSLTVMPQAQRVSGRDGDGEYPLDFEPGLVDRNLVVLAIAADLSRQAKTLQYRVADKRKIETNEYRIAGTEKIKTARGELDAVRIERIRKDSGRQTTTWIAPSLGYLPVRIRQLEPDGETLDMQLR